MTVQIMMKHPGSLAKKVKACPLTLQAAPATLRELITACVDACIAAYRERAKESQNPAPLSDEDPKTAEVISKVLLFAEDQKIKDPMILAEIRR